LIVIEIKMGQCLGKPKNVKTYDSYQLEQARTVSKRRNEEESVEERRRKFAEAAEKRRDSQNNKGVLNSGGKLSKQIQKQNTIGPGRSNEQYYAKNEALDPSNWN